MVTSGAFNDIFIPSHSKKFINDIDTDKYNEKNGDYHDELLFPLLLNDIHPSERHVNIKRVDKPQLKY
jgi:hypothetical protein